jgi:hypothetical protein
MKSAADLEQFLLHGKFLCLHECENRMTDVEAKSRTGTKHTACWPNGTNSFLKNQNLFFCFGRETPQVDQGLLIHEVSRSHSDTPHSVGLIWTVIRSSQRPLPDNTQRPQQTNIYALGGIWTHNPSKRAAADPRLRPRGHWDRRRDKTVV